MERPLEDWAAVMQRVLEGDRLALLRVTRLMNGFLTRWNRLREPQAIVGYLKTTLRFKYVDRLKSILRCRPDESLAWESVLESETDGSQGLTEEGREDLKRALEKVPEPKRTAVIRVYLAGQTYEEAAKEAGIPFGSFKRYLREGLALLRHELAGFLDAT
jgi:RNA polymerase sigma-70 factor (ECF subfamily)